MVKKLLLLPLLFLFLFSCGDKEEAKPSVEEHIKGEWTWVESEWRYYDIAGNLVHKLIIPIGKPASFDGKTFSQTLRRGGDDETEQLPYTVTQRGEATYVLVTQYSYVSERQVMSITDNKLVWIQTNMTPTYREGNVQMKAARAEAISTFTR